MKSLTGMTWEKFKDVMRYGSILEDRNTHILNNRWERRSVVKYDNKLYYIVMIDGDLVVFDTI